jgi:deoxyadenosine/deoxycytidine kinase
MSSPFKVVEPQLIVSVEGNIGIGKSTLLANLRKRFADHPDVVFVDEPVTLWEETGLLDAMYTGQLERCTFQQMAVITRFGAIMAALRTPGARLIITERSIFTDKECFAKVGISDPVEFAAYTVAHDQLVGALPPIDHGTILLHAPLNLISDRIKARGRAAETSSADGAVEIPTSYLQQLEAAHDSYFASLTDKEKRVVDATRTPSQVADDVFNAISELRVPLHGPTCSSPTSVLGNGHGCLLDPMDLAEPDLGARAVC